MKKCQEEQVIPNAKNANEIQNISNSDLKTFLNDFQGNDKELCSKKFHGHNALTHTIITKFEDMEFVIPPHCKFFNCDVRTIKDVDLDDDYDLIVLDPPWWNKFIRRSRSFNKASG